ncbi:MAG: DUF2779 domain-containing protein [Gammaproteobacteria bacterium]
MRHRLSKSKIMSGLQCKKRLWLEVHQREVAAPPDADAQRRFDVGNAVGAVARELHRGGRLVGFDGGVDGAIAETQDALHAHPGAPVFEATFAHDDVAVRVDILEKGVRGYRLIEVKSATSVKDEYYPDCAVQAWVLQGNDVTVERVELAHIDSKFVYGGDGDYRGLLRYADVTEKIAAGKAEAPQWARDFRRVLEGAQPDIGMGAQCRKPYECPFIGHCTAESGRAAEYPLARLPGHKQKLVEEFAQEGIYDIRDIPAGRLRNAKQEWVRTVTISGKADLKSGAKKTIDACAWPRYYLDFETVMFAVPVWKDTRPYESLPFQWSCHVETAPGVVTHAEFLGGADAPMRAFIDTLLRALGTHGAIFVYSPYEKTILNATAARFPDTAAAVENIIARMVDLLPLTRDNYYHPEMRGSWSLKAVLPCIAPQLAYQDLGEVQDGGAAGAAYCEMIARETEPSRATALDADLRAYCKLDTEALVELARFLCGGIRHDAARSDARALAGRGRGFARWLMRWFGKSGK